MTAIHAGGEPLGMTVGSLTSVSNEPEVVVFLLSRMSSSCRALRESGGPVLDGAVACIDCSIEGVHDASAPLIVIGRVRELEMLEPTKPLLFFRGGHGSFVPQSLAAGDGGVHPHWISAMDPSLAPWDLVIPELVSERGNSITLDHTPSAHLKMVAAAGGRCAHWRVRHSARPEASQRDGRSVFALTLGSKPPRRAVRRTEVRPSTRGRCGDATETLAAALPTVLA